MPEFSYYASGSPTHQYYTLALVNPPRDDVTDEFPIVYNETRNSPFLQDPQSYYASIVRFSCSTPLLPVIIPQMKDPEINQTVYSVSMHHPGLNGGAVARRYISFSSLNPFLPKTNKEYYYVYQPVQFINMVNQALAKCWESLTGNPAPNDPPWIAWNDSTNVGTLWTLADLCTTPYPESNIGFPGGYLSSSPSTVVGMIASGPPAAGAPAQFSTLTLTLTTGEGARYLVGDYVNTTNLGSNSQPIPGAPVRIIAVNGDTIILEQRGIGIGYTNISPLPAGASIRAKTPLNIYMNAALYSLFSSFAAENQATASVPNPPNGTHWKLQFAPTNEGTTLSANQSAGGYQNEFTLPQYGDFTVPPSPANRRIYVTQQYSTVPIWSPVSSFVFITSVLPINPEAISIPSVLGNQKVISGGNNSAYGTVLTDFEVPLDNGYENKPVISYVPSAEYRLVDLNGNAPLNTIEISLGWRDKLGVFQPLNIGPNGFAQLKILFRKKDYNGV